MCGVHQGALCSSNRCRRHCAHWARDHSHPWPGGVQNGAQNLPEVVGEATEWAQHTLVRPLHRNTQRPGRDPKKIAQIRTEVVEKELPSSWTASFRTASFLLVLLTFPEAAGFPGPAPHFAECLCMLLCWRNEHSGSAARTECHVESHGSSPSHWKEGKRALGMFIHSFILPSFLSWYLFTLH